MVRTLLIAALALGCSSGAKSSRPPDPMQTPPSTQDPGAVQDRPMHPGQPAPEAGWSQHVVEGRAEGQPCLAPTECTSGICEGEGCGAGSPGRCAPRARACTKDLAPYCGCDGQTFRTSGSCPGQRFASRGECSPP